MEKDQNIYISDYLNIILKRKIVVFACLFVTVITAIIYNQTATPWYEASATLIIDKKESFSPLTDRRVDYESNLSEDLTFNTHFQMLTARPILRMVVEELKLERKVFPVPPEQESLDHYSLDLKEKITITHLKGTRLVTIDVINEDPFFAQKIANTLTEKYLDFTLSSKIAEIKKLTRWLNDQLQIMEKKLEESENAFERFKEQEKIFSLEGKKNTQKQNLDALNSSYIKVKNSILEIETKIQELDILSSSSKTDKSTMLIMRNDTLKEINKKLLDAEISLAVKKQKFIGTDPEIKEIKSKTDILKKTFDAELKKLENNLKSEYLRLKENEKGLLEAITRTEYDALKLNKKEIRYSILERNVNTNKELYNVLLKKIKEIDILKDVENPNVRIVETALLPLKPVSPRKGLIIMLGFFNGLLLGVIGAFFFEYIDRTFRNPLEVDRYLHLPVLSSIPRSSGQLISLTDDFSSLQADAYRVLLTNLTFVDPNKPFKTILFTSCEAREGRTTILVNLGITMARAGKKVLLIDADFRNPSLAKIFSIDHSSGLTNALIDIFNTEVTHGSIDEMSLADIISLIRIKQESGILTLEDSEQVCSVCFEGGKTVNTKWANRPDTKKLATLLVKEGKISKEQMKEALALQQKAFKPLGYILTTILGYVDNDDIESHIKNHHKQNISKAIALNSATYTFTPCSELDPTVYDLGDFKVEEIWNTQLIKHIIRYKFPFISRQIASYIKKTAVENLYLLPGGYAPPDLSGLFESERMRSLITVAKNNFDMILIDSPPANVITDILFLTPLIDKTVIVINAGQSRRDHIQYTKKKLEKSGASIIGAILNRFDSRKRNLKK